MATTLNPIEPPSVTHESDAGGAVGSGVGGELARVAERLRQVTVQVKVAHGGGSGVIWRADGLIATNAHVALAGPGAGAAEPVVVLEDGTEAGRQLPAKVIARDRSRDLAVLKVDATDLPVADIRPTSSLRAGELVLAVGNPMGTVGAVATGILHSAPASASAWNEWLEADVRLAPGNSGGPLADAQGRIIGINSMVAYGMALAIPADVVDTFIAGKRRPQLGVTVEPVFSKEGTVAGLLVVETEPESAAERGGILVGDVLLAADGSRLEGVRDLANAIAEGARSGSLTLDLSRGGKKQRLTVPMAPPKAA